MEVTLFLTGYIVGGLTVNLFRELLKMSRREY